MVFVFLFLLCYPYTHTQMYSFGISTVSPSAIQLFAWIILRSDVVLCYHFGCVLFVSYNISFSFKKQQYLMPNQEEDVKLAISRFMNFKLIQHSNLNEFAALKRLQEIESCDRLNDECENKKETKRKSTNCKSICTGLLSFITRTRFLSARTLMLYVVI